MFKRIMVATDGSDASLVGVRYAAALAKKYKASVVGIHVVDVKLLEGPFLQDLSASLGTTPYVNYQGNIAMLLDERGKAALAQVRSICEEQDVRCDTKQVTGIVSRAIVDNSELVDLIIMGRGGEHSEWLEGLTGSTTEAVVRRAALPVLVTATELHSLNRFLMAYDGTTHARNALKSAAAVAADWGIPFKVLSVGAPETTAPLLREAREYLSSWELQVEFEGREGDAGEVIVETAREYGADLLVMGAYGHSKVREFVVGSTTAYTLNHAPCAVFLQR